MSLVIALVMVFMVLLVTYYSIKHGKVNTQVKNSFFCPCKLTKRVKDALSGRLTSAAPCIELEM